jgi:hypothetical protein
MVPDGQAKNCFDRVMSGEVSWGPDSVWTSNYASLLCAGSHDSEATINCFISRVQQGDAWQLAVLHCKAH